MAIWQKLFNKITFKDYPDTSTPLNANNLNAITNAIDELDDRVVELNSNIELKTYNDNNWVNAYNSALYEIVCIISFTDSSGNINAFSFVVPKAIISDTPIFFLGGYAVSNTGSHVYYQVKLSKTTMSDLVVRNNNSNQSNVGIRFYYR